MGLYENIKSVCKEKHIRMGAIEEAADVSFGSIQRWRKNSPNIESVRRVAECLGVTIDSLVYGKEK